MQTSSLKKFLYEKVTTQEEKLKSILNKDYQTFVKELNNNIDDPKFQDVLYNFSKENPVKFNSKIIPVTKLIPTQNEIDLEKTIKWWVKYPNTLNTILNSKVYNPGNSAIVTSKSKYIIDGHHRWSEAFIVNPDIKMRCLDIDNIEDPIKSLKAVQIGIANDIKQLPISNVNGINLLDVNENTFKKYIENNITSECINVFIDNGIDNYLDYLWFNVTKMRNSNTPISGASKRDYMPQTGDSPQWDIKSAKLENILREGEDVEPEVEIDLSDQLESIGKVSKKYKEKLYELIKNLQYDIRVKKLKSNEIQEIGAINDLKVELMNYFENTLNKKV